MWNKRQLSSSPHWPYSLTCHKVIRHYFFQLNPKRRLCATHIWHSQRWMMIFYISSWKLASCLYEWLGTVDDPSSESWCNTYQHIEKPLCSHVWSTSLLILIFKLLTSNPEPRVFLITIGSSSVKLTSALSSLFHECNIKTSSDILEQTMLFKKQTQISIRPDRIWGTH